MLSELASEIYKTESALEGRLDSLELEVAAVKAQLSEILKKLEALAVLLVA